MDLVSVNLFTFLLAIVLNSTLFIPSVFASSSNHSSPVKVTCGFPGSPRNGRVLNLLEKYEVDSVVSFECDPNYYLLGSITRTCQWNGTWSSHLPVCDQSVTNLGLTSASEALNNYPPHLAVDGDLRTCFFSNRRKPRWWRVELSKKAIQNQSIISVALTLPPINADLHFSIYVVETESNSSNESDSSNSNGGNVSKYHKCATFRGVFSSKSIVVQCARSAGGLKGSFLQIEDDHPQLEYFGLCEVDIFVERDSFECGQVEVPSNGFILDRSTNQSKSVDFFCHEGYRLLGPSSRSCDSTGQWSDKQTVCERITCSTPSPIANGFYSVYGSNNIDTPVLHSKTVYECNPGFTLVGSNDTRVCDSTGEWSGKNPQCEPVDCGQPENLLLNAEDFLLSGARFNFLNGTTKYSAISELICPSTEVIRSNYTKPNLLFRCREDGLWTEVTSTNVTVDNQNDPSTSKMNSNACVKARHNGFLYFYNSGIKGSKLKRNSYLRDSTINMLYFLAAVVLAAFFSILIIVVLLFKRNIIEWPEYSCSFCNPRVKSFGQSIKKSITNVFAQINRFIHSLLNHKLSQSESSQKTPSFTISPSVSDVENARATEEPNTTLEQTPSKPVNELDSALATFYEEITNAAKQVFAEDTDRKLLRAARIAAELDVIKTQQEGNYHWIYASPPRHGTSSLPSSLNPSVHESSQIGSPTQCTNQIYSKVDLIRKHRYRKDRGESSVYQVPPRPRHMLIDPSTGSVSHYCTESSIYGLRKALSSPESVFQTAEGDYATLRQLRLDRTANGNVANDQTDIQTQQFSHIPIQTLL